MLSLLSDIITYVRRVVKSPSNAQLTDSLIIDYINRFWILDVDARLQMFDLKTKYGFQCTPYITSYNMPLYGVNQFPMQSEPAGSIAAYPVYQGFMDPVFVNGIQIPFYTQRDAFYKVWTPYVQTLQAAGTGDGTPGPYTLALPFFPALAGHVDITGIITANSSIDPIVGTILNDPAIVDNDVPFTSLYPGVTINATAENTNQLMTVYDSGQFTTSNQQVGFLQYYSGSTPIQAGTVNYVTGAVSVSFPSNVESGTDIQVNSYFYEPGIPRAMLYYNNIITILPPPNVSYYVEMDAYLSPAAFLNTAAAIPFAYMGEYIARGAARKILSDTGDIEQFQFYEPLFREQEMLVWKRSQRIFTASRTGTIFSDLQSQNTSNANGVGSI